MTRSEQKSRIQDLRYYSRMMSRDDLEVFEGLLKREKDDEDLDGLSEQKLMELHVRYMPKKTKKEVEELWKKLTSKRGPDQKI